MVALADDAVVRFLLQVLVLLVTARALGFAARRIGQPSVVGELLAGLVLGPSVLGSLAPGVSEQLFPSNAVVNGPVLGLAAIGLVLIVLTAGYEVDVPLVRRLLRSTAAIPIAAFVLPLGAGAAVAWLAPDGFLGELADRPLFAAFVGLAMALSALPVIARILAEMGVLRRDIGQITMVSAMADDTVGWLVLGVLTAAAQVGGFELVDTVATVAAVVLFAAAVLVVGQRIVDRLLRASYELTEGIAGAFTITLLVALGFAAASAAAGIDALVGAFLAGVALRRSPLRRREVAHGIELLTTGFLGPLFFATAGMALDARLLASPAILGWTAVLLVVAVLAKIGGAALGATVSRLDRHSAVAIGAGLTARGALGVVIAAVALDAGVFSEIAYTALVAVALVSSAITPPLLDWALARVPDNAPETDRIQRETLLGESLLVNARRVLLPTRGGPHSRLAARIVDLSLDAEAGVTVLSVQPDGVAAADRVVDEVSELFGLRRVDRVVRAGTSPARVVADESRFGYDLLCLGASEDVQTPAELSDQLGQLLVATSLPVLLVRSARDAGEGLVFRRILTAATGTRDGRAAEEVAFVLSTRTGAEVDIVHVISRADRMLHAVWSGRADQHSTARTLLSRSVALAGRFGSVATGYTRVGSSAHEQLLEAAEERRADTIVIGCQIASIGGKPFLGHGVEYLLERATQTLIIVCYPG
ncbi:MAG: cation:proton antiporter [Actinobacteria bacterium]|nr:cation:proton antiporter [Actinomycetota bacterium]